MELQKALRNRRSIRHFKQEKPTNEEIDRVIEAGLTAPKASNRQHWEAVVIDDRELIRWLYREAGAQKIVLNAPTILLILVNKEFNREGYANVQSASAAVQNMLLKAHEMGLGTCWVVGYGNKEKIAKKFNIPKKLEPLCLILIGHPSEPTKKPPTPKIDEIKHQNVYKKKQESLPKSLDTDEWNIEQVRKHQAYLSRASYLGADYEKYSSNEINMIDNFLVNNIPRNSLTATALNYDGTVLSKLARTQGYITIVDHELSKEAIEFIKYKTSIPKYKLINELDKNKFDAAFLIFALEKTPEKQMLIRSLSNSLKPGGKIVICFKNKLSAYGIIWLMLNNVLRLDIESSITSSCPFKPISLPKLKKMLRKNSFKIRKTKTISFMPLEMKAYQEKADGYIKRHQNRLGLFKYAIKPTLAALSFLTALTGFIKIPWISSSVCITASKQEWVSQS